MVFKCNTSWQFHKYPNLLITKMTAIYRQWKETIPETQVSNKHLFLFFILFSSFSFNVVTMKLQSYSWLGFRPTKLPSHAFISVCFPSPMISNPIWLSFSGLPLWEARLKFLCLGVVPKLSGQFPFNQACASKMQTEPCVEWRIR